MFKKSFNINDSNNFYLERPDGVNRDVSIRTHNKTGELLVNTYQRAMNIKKHGRMRGNMQYLEDS